VLDTTPDPAMIRTGTTEQALLAAVVDLSPAELSVALQDAMAAAAKQAASKH